MEHPVTFRDLSQGIDEVSDDDLISLAVLLLSEATHHVGPSPTAE